jgi:enamine deaminase RidA (YjgF/YER057c/UK114 family)
MNTRESPEARLRSLGIVLPDPPTALGNYVPAVRAGVLVFISGQGPMANGRPTIIGKLGAQVSEEQGYAAARQTIINALAVLRAEVGSLDKVHRIVKLLAFVNSAPGFVKQPAIVNGASDLLVEIFGEAGRHARSAVAANELPFNIPVEIEMIVEVNAT